MKRERERFWKRLKTKNKKSRKEEKKIKEERKNRDGVGSLV